LLSALARRNIPSGQRREFCIFDAEHVATINFQVWKMQSTAERQFRAREFYAFGLDGSLLKDMVERSPTLGFPA
jgi:hypothetical protein